MCSCGFCDVAEDLIIQNNSGSKAPPLRSYLAVQGVVLGGGLTAKI